MVQLNWVQRAILIAAGVFMALSALNSASGFYSKDWLIMAQATLAFSFWFVAATPRKVPDV